MDQEKKRVNTQIGKRLRQIRKNLGRTQSEIAASFGVSEEHYRKYESGCTGLSAQKLLVLYREYGMDPTYLLTGLCLEKEFDVDYYVANCNQKQKEAFVDKMMNYMSRVLKR